jgi:glycosyltransferase involved in cell wall biosynthesis
VKPRAIEAGDTAAAFDASVVIPAYRRPALLREAVRSALAQDLARDRFEIIVVDSSPDEENALVVESLQPETEGVSLVLERKLPEGPGPSRMLGAGRARGRVVAFLDSDCRATPGWLRLGLAAFADGIGIVQGRTLPRPDQAIGVLCRYVRVEAENPRYEAANLLYRRECLAAAGEASRDRTPRSERPTGGEDALMAWRVKRNGWRSAFAAEALVYHEVIPISVWQWLYEKRMLMLPWLAREVPEIRSVFFLRYFLDPPQACLTLLLAGLVLSAASPLWLACGIPYLLVRTLEPTRALPGIRRIARVVAYLPRDLLTFGLLLVGSVRHRTLLL